MNAGDDLRRNSERGDAVALLAVSDIRDFRETKSGNPRQLLSRQAYIFNSLKHPNEVGTLREIYREAFFLISIYSPKQERIVNLCKKIARTRNERNTEQLEGIAEQLIAKDSKEVGDDLGQNVRDTFPLGDVFINEKNDIRKQIRRLIEVLFGHPFTTPTVDEYGMFHAKAAALRSSDLSRQVGAVIATDAGEVVATGCNEVPKAGGGSVWEGQGNKNTDYRDFRLGWDTSALMQREMIAEIFKKLNKSPWLTKKAKEADPELLAEKLLDKGKEGLLRDARISSIIEFGRIVHAEMAAITDAARRGVPVKDATLYCTTFPCHMCARHIISSGITRVVYIEPYPKSITKELYKKTVCIEDDVADDDAVMFAPFVGIAPRKYFLFFEMTTRKDDRGFAIEWETSKSTPRLTPGVTVYFPAYQDFEAGYTEHLEKRAAELGLIPPSRTT